MAAPGAWPPPGYENSLDPSLYAMDPAHGAQLQHLVDAQQQLAQYAQLQANLAGLPGGADLAALHGMTPEQLQAAVAQHAAEQAAAYNQAMVAAGEGGEDQGMEDDGMGEEEMGVDDGHGGGPLSSLHSGASGSERRSTRKRSKGGRIAAEISKEELVACFNMPSEEAARHLGIGLTVLKRICRQYGVPRWPFRKIKSLDRLLQNVEQGSIMPGETCKHLMQSAEEIQKRKEEISTGKRYELDDSTKKLQQAYSKFKHKLKAASKEDGPGGGGGGGRKSRHGASVDEGFVLGSVLAGMASMAAASGGLSPEAIQAYLLQQQQAFLSNVMAGAGLPHGYPAAAQGAPEGGPEGTEGTDAAAAAAAAAGGVPTAADLSGMLSMMAGGGGGMWPPGMGMDALYGMLAQAQGMMAAQQGGEVEAAPSGEALQPGGLEAGVAGGEEGGAPAALETKQEYLDQGGQMMYGVTPEMLQLAAGGGSGFDANTIAMLMQQQAAAQAAHEAAVAAQQGEEAGQGYAPEQQEHDPSLDHAHHQHHHEHQQLHELHEHQHHIEHHIDPHQQHMALQDMAAAAAAAAAAAGAKAHVSGLEGHVEAQLQGHEGHHGGLDHVGAEQQQ